ncbi:MAG: glycoside hydrolase domain-containing protein, partial [Armatimonadota bacterium]
MNDRHVVVGALCGLALLAIAATQARAEMVVWTAPATIRVQPEDAPTGDKQIAISAARNEWEPFQVIVTARGEPLSRVTVEATALVGRRTLIGSDNIHLFRQHYIQVTRPSARCDTPAGWWPDALIPFVNPIQKPKRDPKDPPTPFGPAKYRAQPFDVEAGKNQPIWGEVYVPPEAPAGLYEASVTVRTRGAEATVAISLTVRDFVLPWPPSV